MKPSGQYTSIGGQAIIEGVMMRSPHFIAIAVRKPDRKILIRSFPYQSAIQRSRLLRKPLFRGVATLLESMYQGIEALSFSASIAGDEGKEESELSGLAIAGSIFTAFILGMALFVALPHALTAWLSSQTGGEITAKSPYFHLIDGTIKMGILLLYVYLISWMKDIHRVFQYHGAEHKSIYAFEAGQELTVENARKHTALHPRCGTSFLLFLILISIGVFSAVFPMFGLTQLFANSVLNHVGMVLVKIALMLPVAGISYEFIKLCACRMDNPFFKMLIWPGLLLQNLTTRVPEDDQLEVALAALRQVLRLEKGIPSPKSPTEVKPEAEAEEIFEIAQLSELGRVQASVAEFPEI